MSKFLRRLVSPVWPLNCVLCGTPLIASEERVCLGCLSRLPVITNDESIPYLGLPDNHIVVRSWWVYDRGDDSHRLIHHIKYHDMIRLARTLGKHFAHHRMSQGPTPEIILPIPVHWTRRLQRGYNQSREIARGIHDATGIRIGRNLVATRAHSSQTRRSRRERMDNLEGTFAVRHPEALNGLHIALLDDVITTGATMFEALDSILAVAKPSAVTFLSLCRSRNF